MRINNKFLVALALPLFFSFCVGCASTKQSTKLDMPSAGFLSSYSKMEPGSGEPGISDWVYQNPDVDFTKYDKVMVDHVAIFLSEDADYKGIDASELSDLSELFHKKIIAALEPTYPLTDKPGPNVMRIRLAIVDLVPTNPAASALTTIVPIGLAAIVG